MLKINNNMLLFANPRKSPARLPAKSASTSLVEHGRSVVFHLVPCRTFAGGGLQLGTFGRGWRGLAIGIF